MLSCSNLNGDTASSLEPNSLIHIGKGIGEFQLGCTMEDYFPLMDPIDQRGEFGKLGIEINLEQGKEIKLLLAISDRYSLPNGIRPGDSRESVEKEYGPQLVQGGVEFPVYEPGLTLDFYPDGLFFVFNAENIVWGIGVLDEAAM